MDDEIPLDYSTPKTDAAVKARPDWCSSHFSGDRKSFRVDRQADIPNGFTPEFSIGFSCLNFIYIGRGRAEPQTANTDSESLVSSPSCENRLYLRPTVQNALRGCSSVPAD